MPVQVGEAKLSQKFMCKSIVLFLPFPNHCKATYFFSRFLGLGREKGMQGDFMDFKSLENEIMGIPLGWFPRLICLA